MQNEKTEEYIIPDYARVKYMDLKGIVKVQYMEKMNTECPVRIIDKDHYCLLETGEVFEIDHSKNRVDDYVSLRRTFRNLSDDINMNFNGAKNELFVTLTYGGENRPLMSDSERFYTDFKIFMKTLRRKYGRVENIVVIEPHESGHLHSHVLLQFLDYKSIFIPKGEMAIMWGKGYIELDKLTGITNVGAYLSAYLTDIPLTEQNLVEAISEGRTIKEVDGKKFIKGGRLKYYQKNTKIYRKSRGMKKPDPKYMTWKEAQKKTGSAKPEFEKAYTVEHDDFTNTIVHKHFNLRTL